MCRAFAADVPLWCEILILWHPMLPSLLRQERTDESLRCSQPVWVCDCKNFPFSHYHVHATHLCWDLVFVSLQAPCRLVCFLSCCWTGECASVLAAPRHRLPSGQGQLNGSVWPKRFPFWGGNGVYIIRVNDTSWFLAVFPFFFSSLSLLLSSLFATKWHQYGCCP